jgi:hypothetical protein
LGNANITRLLLTNGTIQNGIYLNETLIGTDWGWDDLNETIGFGIGYYRVWYIADKFPVSSSDTILFAIPTIVTELYQDVQNFYCPTTISPVGTNLYMNATPTGHGAFTPNFQLITLYTDEQTTVVANFSIMQAGHPQDGAMLSDAMVSYAITNKSSNLVIESSLMNLELDGTFSIVLSYNDLSTHEFLIVITANYLNYTTIIRQFTLIIGQSSTILSHTVDPFYKGDPNNHNVMKVAYGENFTCTVEVTGADFAEAWVEVYIGQLPVPSNYIYRQENSRYFDVRFPIPPTILANQYQVTVRANKIGQIPSNITFLAQILETWPARLHVTEPPMRYPWGNIVNFNTTYYCTEYPRVNLLLTGATIKSLEILLILQDSQPQVLYLTEEQLNVVWWYQELIGVFGKGNGHYQIFFDSSVLNLTKVEAYYIIPTIQVDKYEETYARPRPNFYLYPLPTALSMTQHTTINDLNLQNMQVFLDDELSVNLAFFVNDPNSRYHSNFIDGDLSYIIYDRVTSNIVSIGTLQDMALGQYRWTIPTQTIGNYSIVLIASNDNHITSVIQFNLLVMKYLAGANLISENRDLVVATPQNNEIVIIISAIDNRTLSPLTGASVIATFEGKEYLCEEDPTSPGAYRFTVLLEDLERLSVGEVYVIRVRISKVNYTDFEYTLFLKIDLPVDPYFGVPYAYWAVMGIATAAFLATAIVRKSIIQARIPVIIKRLTLAQKIITKNKVVPDRKLMLTSQEELYKRFNKEWKLLDLDMAESLGIEKVAIVDEELQQYFDTDVTLDKSLPELDENLIDEAGGSENSDEQPEIEKDV